MKQIRILATWLAASAVAFAMAANATAQSSKERVGTVTKMKGAARVSSGNNIWRPLKVGDVVKPGMVVQSAGSSYVDIVFGDGGAAATATSATPARAGLGAGGGGKTALRQDVVRVSADTVLAIDKLSSVETGADKVTETELDLRSGKIFGDVKKQSAASRFEVKIPNGVAGIRGTTFSMSSDGVVSVLSGVVTIAWTPESGPAQTKDVPKGFRFDIRTGVMSKIPDAEMTELEALAALGLIPVYTTIEYTVDRTIFYVSPKIQTASTGGGNGGYHPE